VYEVQKGDTLLAIAIRFDIDVDEIMEANGIESAHRLSVGQKLAIPMPDEARPTRTPTPTATITPVTSPVAVTHVVRGGETWEVIAQHYFVTVEALWKANPDIDPEDLQPGDELIVPVESDL
jgi:LysM repeat protein